MGVVMGLLSRKVCKQARKLGVSYSFMFMQANGARIPHGDRAPDGLCVDEAGGVWIALWAARSSAGSA